MSKNRLKSIHSNFHNGFIGTISDEDIYEDVKNGNKDWKPHIKSKMTAITIPASVFYRLMELDKIVEKIVDVGHPNIIISEELKKIMEGNKDD